MNQQGRVAPASRWIVGGAAEEAPLRLYCFPHAGGSAAEYLRWGRRMPGVRVYAIQLPGRATRFGEPAVTSMDALVGALLEEEFTGPYAFFGHSMGSLVAYELTCALRDAGRRLPERLVVSSGPAPDVPRNRTGVHRLPDDELLSAVNGRHNGIPSEVLDHPELRAMATAGLRADYTVLEEYEWRGHAPLPVPLTALAGDGETALTEGDKLTGWARHTTRGPVEVRTFSGGHFYLREQETEVVQQTLAELLGAKAGSGSR
ncbi:thioesterase II family protein [Streptomyces albireticuli]|uniref:thioesterase II family protein n=1 Tax=Streptomyces albireticuli TaxID=1940 RepID=UPI0036776B16